MRVTYIVRVGDKGVQVEEKFRYLFHGKAELPYGKYHINFHYQQIRYERDIQLFLRAHPEVGHEFHQVGESIDDNR